MPTKKVSVVGILSAPLAPRTQTILEGLVRERTYQNLKWGTVDSRPHEVAGWLMIAENHLNVAKDFWSNLPRDDEALFEILKVMAVCCACLEQHGIVMRTEEEIKNVVNSRENE